MTAAAATWAWPAAYLGGQWWSAVSRERRKRMVVRKIYRESIGEGDSESERQGMRKSE